MSFRYESVPHHRLASATYANGREEAVGGLELQLLSSRRNVVPQRRGRCVHDDEKEIVLQEAHCRIAGGHYAGDATAQKIWQAGLWWPTTQKDTQVYCRKCDLCQRLGQPTERARLSHQPVLPLEPFQKWTPYGLGHEAEGHVMGLPYEFQDQYPVHVIPVSVCPRSIHAHGIPDSEPTNTDTRTSARK